MIFNSNTPFYDKYAFVKRLCKIFYVYFRLIINKQRKKCKTTVPHITHAQESRGLQKNLFYLKLSKIDLIYFLDT